MAAVYRPRTEPGLAIDRQRHTRHRHNRQTPAKHSVGADRGHQPAIGRIHGHHAADVEAEQPAVALRGHVVAGALSAYPRKAGTVSALVGAVQFSVGAVATVLTGWVGVAHAFGYVWVVGTMAVCGLVSNLVLLRPRP